MEKMSVSVALIGLLKLIYCLTDGIAKHGRSQQLIRRAIPPSSVSGQATTINVPGLV
jgi:hypothetical protein